MNVVSVRIIFSFWDFNTDIFRVGEKLVFEELFEIDIDISKLENKLYELIMKNKNDGMSLEVNSSGGLHFVEIDLFLGELGDTYDISYIIDFLSQFKKLESIPDTTKDLSKFQGFIYIKDTDKLEEIIELLKSYGLNPKKIGMTTYKYERGASDLWEAYLLGIASSASIELIKPAINNLLKKFNNNRDIQFGTFNIQKLKENVANLLEENIQNLELISFKNNNDEDRYSVIFTTRYQKVFVETNSSGTIIEFNAERKTQTRI